MRTNPTKLFDDLVEVGANPHPTVQDEINAKVAELENKLTDMIENKFSTINTQADATESTTPTNISQETEDGTETNSNENNE